MTWEKPFWSTPTASSGSSGCQQSEKTISSVAMSAGATPSPSSPLRASHARSQSTVMRKKRGRDGVSRPILAIWSSAARVSVHHWLPPQGSLPATRGRRR